MAIDVDTSGSAIQMGVASPLFPLRLAGTIFNSAAAFGAVANTPYPYVVTRDGQRFLVSVDASDQVGETPLTIVLNWTSTLRS